MALAMGPEWSGVTALMVGAVGAGEIDLAGVEGAEADDGLGRGWSSFLIRSLETESAIPSALDATRGGAMTELRDDSTLELRW